MEVGEGLLSESRRNLLLNRCARNHNFSIFEKNFRLWRLDCVDIPSNQFQFGIIVSYSRVVINGYPPINISLSFVLIQNHRIVSFPFEACSPICNFNVSSFALFTKNFPIQGRFGVKPFRQSRKYNAFYIVVDTDTVICSQNKSVIIAKQSSDDFNAGTAQFNPQAISLSIYFSKIESVSIRLPW